MDKQKLEEFKNLLLNMKAEILNSTSVTGNNDLCVSSDDLADEADLATNVINQQVSLAMREREMRKLQSIQDALMRIDNGEYGLCEDCDEEIEYKRLKNQPWTTLCIEHAEEREREQNGGAPFRRVG